MARLVLNYLRMQLIGIPCKLLLFARTPSRLMARLTRPVKTAKRLRRGVRLVSIALLVGGIKSAQLGQANRTCTLSDTDNYRPKYDIGRYRSCQRCQPSSKLRNYYSYYALSSTFSDICIAYM